MRGFARSYLQIFRFLTVWVILLTLLSHVYGDIANTFNLVFLALCTLIGGSYIAFIHPRYYTFKFGRLFLKIDNPILLFLIESIVHFMLLVYILQRYNNTYTLLSWQTMNSIALLCAYFLLHDVKSIYHLRKVDVRNIVMAFTVVLLLYQMFIEK
jgi:hypothetical protein